MSTEYTVALRNLVSGPAREALRDTNNLRTALGSLEAQPARVSRGRGTDMRRIAADYEKMAAQAEKAHSREQAAAARAAQRSEAQAARAAATKDRLMAREQAAQLRLEAQAVRSVQQSETQRRNAAFRRLQAALREEERGVREKERLAAREVRNRERAERQMLAAELRRINAAQRAEQRAEAAARRHLARQEKGGGFGSALAMAGGIGAGVAVGGALFGRVYEGIGYAAGEALSTAKQMEGARMRLTALLGSEDAAKAEIRDMVRAASKTKFDWQDLVDATSSLSASFPDTGERRYVLASLADMVSVAGGGKEQLNQVVLALNQVVGKGKLEAEELNQLIEPLKGVVSRKDFYLEVARLMKVTGKDEQSVIDKMQKLQEKGKVGSTFAVQAVTNVGRAKVGGGAAGSFAGKTGDTVEGQISNIKTGLSTLFATSDMEKWPAFVALRGLLSDVAKLFEVGNDKGAFLMNALEKGLTGKVVPAINFVRSAFNRLMADEVALNQIINGISTLATAAIYAGSAFVMLGTMVVGAIGFIEDAVTFTYDLGKSIVLGIAEGIKSAVGFVYEAITNLGSGIIDTLKAKLSISSPSRVMMQLGAATGEGYALGVEGGARRVGDASRMLAGAAVGGAGAGGGGRSYSVTVNVTLPVQTAGSGAELAQQAGPLLGGQIELVLDRYFGRMQAQGT